MDLPPNLSVGAVLAQTSNAVANTQTNITVLGAPGVGFRYRVWGFGIALLQNSPAGKLRSIFQSGAGVTNLATLTTGTTTEDTRAWWPPGGVLCGTNAILRIATLASVASMTFDVYAYFTNEAG